MELNESNEDTMRAQRSIRRVAFVTSTLSRRGRDRGYA
jgi:hypothetical protein